MSCGSLKRLVLLVVRGNEFVGSSVTVLDPAEALFVVSSNDSVRERELILRKNAEHILTTKHSGRIFERFYM